MILNKGDIIWRKKMTSPAYMVIEVREKDYKLKAVTETIITLKKRKMIYSEEIEELVPIEFPYRMILRKDFLEREYIESLWQRIDPILIHNHPLFDLDMWNKILKDTLTPKKSYNRFTAS